MKVQTLLIHQVVLVIMPLNLVQKKHLLHHLLLRNQVKLLCYFEFCFRLVLQLLIPLKLFSGDNPSEYQSSQLGHSETFSKLWILRNKSELTPEQVEKIDDLVKKIQPKFPVLVVQMKKTSANHKNPSLVSALILFAH